MRFETEFGNRCKPWESNRNSRLWNVFSRVNQFLGLENVTGVDTTPGASDVNFLLEHAPNAEAIDGLGLTGEHFHGTKERSFLRSGIRQGPRLVGLILGLQGRENLLDNLQPSHAVTL